ncbi:hypothetical protein [Stratiformator vulcanicus]|uniref:Uncharacterized protein n=1 Tax=Stratiformator vulcanicus TaxID=2527980 RepID=A0A517R4B0_9PLAN|nr:hypothetical protein [Stratiformator vulcanicus]QDT38707.1 hypothetical protein Pan189_31030 [Stratiformator vulcanicus]
MSTNANLPSSFVIRCGSCGESVRITLTNDEIVCPHCGSRLMIPDEPDELKDEPLLAVRPVSQDAETVPIDPRTDVDDFDDQGEDPPQTSPLTADDVAADDNDDGETDFSLDQTMNDDKQTDEDGAKPGDADTVAEAFDWPDTETPDLGNPDTTETVTIPSGAPLVDEDAETAEFVIPAIDTSADDSPATRSPSKPSRSRKKKPEKSAEDGETVSRQKFLLVLIYASAASALCLVLLYLQLTARTHQLESLPDTVVPSVDQDGNVTRVRIPPSSELPPGHTLELGESQRFGDLRVTPLRVSRGPLQFTHYSNGTTRTEDDLSTLKLSVKFENVGDEAFVPLDADLLFYRAVETGGSEGIFQWANNFVREAGAESGWEDVSFLYDHVTTGEWDLQDQKLGTKLEPGESIETYIPMNPEAASDVNGPLFWRIHLRKGIADNGWGITTLIEIPFDPAKATPESQSKSKESQGPDA